MVQHRRGKNHKRRLRSLREEPYTQKEAEAAVGLRTDNGRREASNTMELDENLASMETQGAQSK